MTRRSFSREPEAVRRRDLIQATLDSVAELGLAGATVREVAERAGVTQGLIRRYFQSKERLVEAAYRSFIGEMTLAAEAAAGEGPASLRLARVIQATVTQPIADRRTIAIWAAFISALGGNPAMAAIHREEYRAYLVLLERLIGDVARERGTRLDAGTIRRRAIALNALIDGLWLEIPLAGDDFAGVDLVDVALEGAAALLGLPPSAFKE